MMYACLLDCNAQCCATRHATPRYAASYRAALRLIAKAISGIVLMSADLEAMYNAFLIQKVPGNWEKAPSRVAPSARPLTPQRGS